MIHVIIKDELDLNQKAINSYDLAKWFNFYNSKGDAFHDVVKYQETLECYNQAINDAERLYIVIMKSYDLIRLCFNFINYFDLKFSVFMERR
jgi:hypothetical protein